MNKFYKGMTTLAFASIIMSPLSSYALTKTETVYSNLNANGSVNTTNINVSLTDLEEGEVVDYSRLDDIKNVNGEEKFSKDSEKLVWKSTGKDIFYKGKLNSELPITVSAKYYLNGEEKELKDITGKSGSIKMVFTFKNHSYDYNTHMYTPFVVSTVSMIPSKNNSNVNTSTGKVVNTGNKTIVTAISAPGIYESTDIDELKDMDEVVITYDTDKFKMNEVYFVITPKLLEEADISKLDKVINLKGSLNTLQSGVNDLQSGSNTLYEGSNTLTDGLTTLNNGLKEALDGSTQITDGLKELQSGTSSMSGLTTLVDGLYAKYNENNTLLANIMSGNTQAQLEAGIANATAAKTQLENQLTAVNAGITTLEQLSSTGTITEEQAVQLETLRGQKTELEGGIAQYANGIAEAQANLALLPQAPAKITGANEVISVVLPGVLGVSSMEQVNEETIQIFKTKINTLISGVDMLSTGSNDLTNGLGELYEGSNKLVEGSTKLSEGNKQLLDGITKLNNEGISKLNEYGNKVSNYSEKIENLVNLSKNYKGFSSNNADKTIFIYKLSNK